MILPHNAVLKAQAFKLGWTTATFVPTKKLSSAWERCSSQGHGQRPWLGVITSNSVWTSVIAQCHPNCIGDSDCSSGVHWFVLGTVVEPATHMFWWDTKGSELYMRPLIQQLRDKGIPLTAKALGFQHLDGWTCGYRSLSLLRQLLQTDPVLIWACSLPNACHRPL